MTNPSTKPVVKALLSQIALIADAPNDSRYMGLGVTASITDSRGCEESEDTYDAEASTIARSHPMNFVAIV